MSFLLGWETDTSTLPHLTLGSGGQSQRAGKYFGCSALLKGKVSSVVVCCVHVCVCVCVRACVHACVCGALLEADAPIS